MNKVSAALKDVAHVEKPTSLEGRNMTMVLTPVAAKPTKEAKETREVKETVRSGKES